MGRLAARVHPADPPDLLRRPLPRPIWVHQPITTKLGKAIRCPNLEQVQHFKAAHSQEADPIAVPEVKFDARLVGPLEPMHPEVRAQQPIGCRPFVVRLGHRQHPERAVAEEAEFTTRAQDAGSLGNPAVRIGPDSGAVLADGQVEVGIGQAVSSALPWISGKWRSCSSCKRRAVLSCSAELSIPVTWAPRRASQGHRSRRFRSRAPRHPCRPHRPGARGVRPRGCRRCPT